MRRIIIDNNIRYLYNREYNIMYKSRPFSEIINIFINCSCPDSKRRRYCTRKKITTFYKKKIVDKCIDINE